MMVRTAEGRRGILRPGSVSLCLLLATVTAACGSSDDFNESGVSNECVQGADAGTTCPDSCAGDTCLNDTTAPQVTLDSSDKANSEQYRLQGYVEEENELRTLEVRVNDRSPKQLTPQTGEFSTSLSMAPGTNRVVVEATDRSGNTGQATMDVEYEPGRPEGELKADFTVSGESMVNKPIVFDGTLSNLPPEASVDFHWQFGDGNRGSGRKTVHTFSSPGTYIVRLTVSLRDDQETSVHVGNIAIDAPKTGGPEGQLDLEVVDSMERPVEGATVVGSEGRESRETGRLGRVQLEGLPTGHRIAVRIRKDGFLSRTLAVRLPESAQKEPVFRIVRLQEAAESMSVRASQNMIEANDSNTRVQVSRDAVQEAWSDKALEVRVQSLSPETLSQWENEGVRADGTRAPISFAGGAAFSFRSSDHQTMAFKWLSHDGTRYDTAKLNQGEHYRLNIADLEVQPAHVDEAYLWWFDPTSGSWVQRSKVTVSQNQKSVEVRVPQAGIWAIGRSFRESGTLNVECARPESLEGDTGPCTLQFSQQGMEPFARRIVVSSSATRDVDVPSGTVCVRALMDRGGCSAKSCFEVESGATTQAQLQPTCDLTDARTVNYGDDFEDSIEEGESATRYLLDGNRGDGLVATIEEQYDSVEKLSLAVRTPSGRTLSEVTTDFRDRAGLILPSERTYVLEVSTQDTPPANFNLKIENQRTVEFDNSTTDTFESGKEAGSYIFEVTDTPVFVNVGMFGNIEPGDVSIYGLGGAETRRSSNYDGFSGLYKLDTSGYYSARINRDDDSGPTADVTVAANAIESPSSLQFNSRNRATVEGELTNVGDRRYYKFDASRGAGYRIRLVGKGDNAESRLNNARLELNHIGDNAEITDFGKIDPVRGRSRPGGFRDAIDVIAGEVPENGTYTVSVVPPVPFEEPSSLGGYRLTVDRVPPDTDRVVGDSNCQNADTSSIQAALFSVESGGSVELCEGDYRTNLPLILAEDRVELAGQGPGKSSIRVMQRNAQIVDDEISRAAGHVNGNQNTLRGLELQFLLHPTARSNWLSIVTNQGATQLPGHFWDDEKKFSVGTEISLTNLELDVAEQRRVEDGILVNDTDDSRAFGENILKDIKVQDAVTGISINKDCFECRSNTSGHVEMTGSTVNAEENAVTVEAVETVTFKNNQIGSKTSSISPTDMGLELRKIYRTTVKDNKILSAGTCLSVSEAPSGLDGTQIVENNCEMKGTGIVFEEAHSASTERDTRLVDNALVSLAGVSSPSRGLYYQGGNSKTSVLFSGNRVKAQTGVKIGAPRISNGTTGTYRINNNVITDAFFGIDIEDFDALDSVQLHNNSIRISSWRNAATVKSDLRSYSGSGVLPLEVYNNIFLVGSGTNSDAAVSFPDYRPNAPFEVEMGSNLIYDFQTAYRGVMGAPADSDIVGKAPDFRNSMTLEPASSSPAVDAGNCQKAPSTGYNGTSRPAGADCDIGAYEQ